ncbi:MAG: TOMM precursor leader peptide-binding protein [Polyangiaceae bacterium]
MLLLEMSEVLSFRQSLRAEPVGEVVFLIGERERIVLSGAATVVVTALVDGRRSVAEIVQRARTKTSEPEALYALHQLVARGHLVPAVRDAAPSTVAFWQSLGVNGSVAAQGLRRSVAVQVLAGTNVHPDVIASALAGAGLRVDQDAALRVVVTDDYLTPELASLNANRIRTERPWLLLKPNGAVPFIGPLFMPNDGPCWECLAFWLRGNRPVEELVRRQRQAAGPVSPPQASLPASIQAVAHLAAVGVARALASEHPLSTDPLHAALFALDLAVFQLEPHAVTRRPQCAACGDPTVAIVASERPIHLAAVAKSYREDGGYRRASPRATFARFKHLVSPITGAVSHLVPMPGRDTELRAVYASGYLVSPRQGVALDNVFDKPCAGKGRGAEQARVSALCEALERYSGVYRGDESRLRASALELGGQALSLPDLLHFSDAQYAARTERNPNADVREQVPEPFDPNTAIDWAPAWSLTRNERRYAPLAYCYAEAPAEVGTVFCRPCGNGVAAGTCLEEAVLQGLLELVERDAAAIWWYNELPRPAVDLQSFGEPYFQALVDDYTRLGWKVWVLDLTHDLDIPSAVAIAQDLAADRFSIGFGCHLEPRLAVQRALTELNQVFDSAGTRKAPWDLDRLVSRRYLFPDRDVPLVQAAQFPRAEHADLAADIEHCVRRLSRAGLEVVVADKTRPDLGICVAQVMVPGLRHFWPRFAPGRLYEVPQQLGWSERRRSEPELNRVPLFV